MRKLGLTFAASALVLVTAFAAAAVGQNPSGFKTSQASMLTVLAPAKPTVPLITTGETMPGGYRFEAIPDGIALRARGQGRVDLFVNHETSRVPFPYTPSAPTEANSQNDFDNSQVSQLVLNQRSAGVLSGKYAIASSANYQRFCTNYMGTEREGFDRPLFFANEEAQDWVFRTGNAWPGPNFISPGTAGAEQAGVTAAYDVRTGKTKTIYGMGRLNHENTVALPVNDGIAVLTTDDTFFTTQDIPGYPNAWSQLYMYLADDVDDLMNDGGDLYAFVSETAGYDDYFDFNPTVPVASQPTIDGHFIKVPKHIATGEHPVTGAELLSTSTGAGYTGMLPPPSGVTAPPPDGPQWVLDQWGNANINAQDSEPPATGENVFRFVRLEDIAYDKRPGMSNNVYITDTGRATGGAAPTLNRSTNGRIWKFVLDPNNPTDNVELSMLVEGDDNPTSSFSSPSPPAAVGEIHQADNIDTTANGSLFVQEDPSSGNQFSPTSTDPNATTARIWRVDLTAASPDAARSVVARIDQSADEGATDVDGPQTSPPTIQRASLGSWESSGIIDASSVFGPGAYLTTIQAHSLWVEKANGPDLAAPAGPDYTFKREGGQLVLFFLNPSW